MRVTPDLISWSKVKLQPYLNIVGTYVTGHKLIKTTLLKKINEIYTLYLFLQNVWGIPASVKRRILLVDD